jgi:Xaa-Pro aminopeptidase
MTSEGARFRHQQIQDILERSHLGAIVLGRFANFAWYTGGADNRVDHSAPFGVAQVVVTPDRQYVLTNSIEGERIRTEQTPEIEVVSYPWYEDPAPTLRELSAGKPVGSDGGVAGSRGVSAEVETLRRVLDVDAMSQYREVGQGTVAAVEEAAADLTPGMSEFEAAARLEAACRQRGLYSPVVMAAGDDRITRYRHPVVHDAEFHRRVMLVVCGERYGLYACLTRFVHFEEPDTELQHRFTACDTILQRMRAEATRPGTTLADAFEECRRFYAEAGFGDEWKLHHQGGITGYATREVVATPLTKDPIRVGQAFAWNPSITGAKAEETFVLTDSGPEIITNRADVTT